MSSLLRNIGEFTIVAVTHNILFFLFWLSIKQGIFKSLNLFVWFLYQQLSSMTCLFYLENYDLDTEWTKLKLKERFRKAPNKDEKDTSIFEEISIFR